MRKEAFVVREDQAGKRLDVCAVECISDLSRSQLKTLGVEPSLNGNPLKWSYLVSEGEEITLVWQEPTLADLDHLIASDIPLDILYEDKDCLVINKPVGMVVHPGIGHTEDTLVNALLSHVENLEEEFKEIATRPGLVHRLDKDTSGLVVCAKTTQSLEMLSGQFRSRKTEKYYLALIKGRLKTQRGIIHNSLVRDPRNRQKYVETSRPDAGKIALTHWRVLREWDKYSLVLLRPVTGRTHQLRVHMLGEGTPILGDVIYSRNANLYPRLFLHAWQLSIALPSDGEEEVHHFLAPIPQEFLTFFQEQEPKFEKEIWFTRLSEGTIVP